MSTIEGVTHEEINRNIILDIVIGIVFVILGVIILMAGQFPITILGFVFMVYGVRIAIKSPLREQKRVAKLDALDKMNQKHFLQLQRDEIKKKYKDNPSPPKV